MAKKRERVGGARRADPDTEAWSDRATPNLAAMSRKQRYDRERIRVRIDTDEVVKQLLAQVSAEQGTSSNQLGSLLMAWGLLQFVQGNEELLSIVSESRRTSRNMRVDFDIIIPDEILTELERTLGSGA